MDHTAFRSTFSHDMMSQYATTIDASTPSENPVYSQTQYPDRSSTNYHSQLEYGPPAYSHHYNASASQGYQSNMSETALNPYMSQAQPQPHSDNIYPFQTPTPPFFSQKHQHTSHQLLQSPTPPCHNQTSSVRLYQSPGPQFPPAPPYSQSSPMSPRGQVYPQTAQPHSPLLSNQKSQQMQSLQHQPAFLMNGKSQSPRQEPSPKQINYKQLNSSKDSSSESHYYPNRVPQRLDTSVHSTQKTQAHTNSFGNRTKPSPVQVFTSFQGEGKANGDAQARNIQNQFGENVRVQNANQLNPASYTSPPSSEHQNRSLPSGFLENRFDKNERVISNSLIAQKASSGHPIVPQVSSTSHYYPEFGLLAEYNMASTYSQYPNNAKVPPGKSRLGTLSGDFFSVQSMPNKTSHPGSGPSQSVEAKNSTIYAKSMRPVTNDAFQGSQSSRADSTNNYSVFSMAALGTPVKVGPNVGKTAAEKSTMAQKKTSENTSPVHWYRCADNFVGSSFQSDIEAMQADLASYVSSNVTHTIPSKTSHILESQTGQNKTSQTLNTQKNGSISRDSTSKSGSNISSKNSKEEALAAIQIKQELMDNLNRFKTANSNKVANNSSTKEIPAAETTPQGSSSNVANNGIETVRLVNNVSTNLSTAMKSGGNSRPQLQTDMSIRRHTSADINLRITETDKSGQNFSTPSLTPNRNRDSGLITKTYINNSHELQNSMNSSQSKQQAPIQTRRHTSPCFQDLLHASSPNQGHGMGSQRELSQKQKSLDFPNQNIIHHLHDQVQSLDMQHSHAEQQNGGTINKSVQNNSSSTVSRYGQGIAEPRDKQTSSEQINLTTSLGRGTQQDVTSRSSLNNQNTGTHPYIGTVRLTEKSNKNNVPNAENVTPLQLFCNKTNTVTTQEIAPATQRLIKMEKSSEHGKVISKICYIMLHGHKLICLKSNIEEDIICCQFQWDCFPNNNNKDVNICINQTLEVRKKVLDHHNKDKIGLFLKRSGYHCDNTIYTISLNDAQRVYHHLHGITSCQQSTCVVSMFDDEVDLDAVVSSSSQVSMARVKKEKRLGNAQNYGQLTSFINKRVPDTSVGKEQCQNGSTSKSQTKLPDSMPSISLPRTSHSDFGISGSDSSITLVGSSDCDDDLIFVEASEDPHVIRWSGDSVKVGGLCNTLIGQIRSYIHEKERFLVADDLCRIFGSSDFYDSVEKENYILYSCCQEIADFLNAISSKFPPLLSLQDSLIKESDIGTFITDSNFVPVESDLDKTVTDTLSLKRPLCKQEIIDDDCSSPKHFRFENTARALKSDVLSVELQSSLLKHSKVIEESIITTDTSDMVTDVNISRSFETLLTDLQEPLGTDAQIQLPISKETSDQLLTSDPLNQPLLGSDKTGTMIFLIDTEMEGPENSVHCSNKSTLNLGEESNRSNIIKSAHESVDNSYRISINSSCSSQVTDSTLNKNSQQLVNEACHVKTPVTAIADTTCNATKEANKVNTKDVNNISTYKPNYTSSSESPRPSSSLFEFSSPVVVDLNNPLLTSSNETEMMEQDISMGSNFVSQDHQPFKNSLPVSTASAASHTSSVQTSSNKSFGCDSKSQSENHIQENNFTIQETIISAPSETSSTTSKGFTDCLEDLILVEQNSRQEKLSSIWKERMEKIKHILETRKSKDLPLPKIVLDTNLNLRLITNEESCVKVKNYSSESSGPEVAVEKLSDVNHYSVRSSNHSVNDSSIHNTETTSELCDHRNSKNHSVKDSSTHNTETTSELFDHSNSKIHSVTDSSIHNTQTTSNLCDLGSSNNHSVNDSSVLNTNTTEPCDHEKNNSKTCLLESSRESKAAKHSTNVHAEITLLQPPLSSSCKESSPREANASTELSEDQIQPHFLKLSRSSQGYRRFLDDTDVMNSSCLNLPDEQPLCYSRVYNKLKEENKALQDVVNKLKERVSQLQADKDKYETKLKHYEGIIYNVTSTLKNAE